jgi:hypothetical protein
VYVRPLGQELTWAARPRNAVDVSMESFIDRGRLPDGRTSRHGTQPSVRATRLTSAISRRPERHATSGPSRSRPGVPVDARSAFVFDRQDRLTGAAPLLRALASSPAQLIASWGAEAGLARIRRPTKQFSLGQIPRIARVCYQGIAIKPVDAWDHAHAGISPNGHDLDDQWSSDFRQGA